VGCGIAWLPETIRKVVNVLSGALQLAVDDGRLPANPAVKLKLPKRVRAIKRYLTHDQVAALAQAVGDRSKGSEHGYDILVLTLAYCGLRWGELAGLRVRDIDFARKRLTVEQTVVADKGYQRIEQPKDYEHRSIPIPAFLVDALRSQTRDSETAGSIPLRLPSGSRHSRLMNCVIPQRVSLCPPAPT
jgi:integrase